MRGRVDLVVAALFCVVLPTAALAQTTGTIEGTAADENGQPLPGVTIEATSANLQGTGVATADGDGRFRFDFLPPGTYRVRCSLEGFTAVEQEEVAVGLGRTVTLSVEMHSAITDEIVVSGAPPRIDLRTVEVGANITSSFFLALPMERNYVSVVQAAPGTATDKAGTTVYGSTGAENAYYIDDVNTTGVWKGQQGKALNFEFIQELQVKTGAYAAEFGRSTGGVVNVITKSGGNEFHGDGFGYYFSDGLQASRDPAITSYIRENAGSSYIGGFVKADLGADVGGYLMRDRLWFFAAYDAVKNVSHDTVAKDFSAYGGPPEGKVYDNTTKTQLWSAKLTGRPGVGHSLVLTAFGDPSSQDGPKNDANLNGEESTFLAEQEFGGTDGALKYQGVLGQHVILDALVAHHAEQTVIGGPGVSAPLVTDATTAQYAQTRTPYRSGGLGGYGNSQVSRDAARASATFFLGHLAGDHELKLGGDGERLHFQIQGGLSGGQGISILCAKGKLTSAGCVSGWTYYSHGVRLSAIPPGGVLDPDFASYVAVVQTFETTWKNAAAFLQDSWRVSSHLTFSLGVRWERQLTYDFEQQLQLDLDNEWSPRVGFVWDIRGDGASKVFASWGRFYETVPLSVSRAFTNFISAGVSNHDPTAIFCEPTFVGDPRYNRCILSNPAGEPVDPAGVRGQYVDEWVLGAELAVSRDLVVGAKVLHRDLGRVIEDSGSPDGYYIGNPGYGALSSVIDETEEWTFVADKPRRRFRGVELAATKRFSNDWQLMASYLWSKLEGSYDGLVQIQTGQIDPNVNSAFDYAEFQIHNDGYLANDRSHQLKLAGSYTFPFGLDVGGSAFLRSGTPITAMGWDDYYGNAEYYLSQRGQWDRGAWEYEASLHLGYPIKLGGVEINLLADVFNLLNRQGETARDQDYTLAQVLDVIDYANGTALPPIANGTPCTALVTGNNAIYCNPGFDKASAWQDPRSVRLGVRLTF
jgi:hypothetical protein